jgi:tetratricopeptide (TPR) repeat protein/uncharacterized RDD family membrane protein YckC
MQYYGNNYVMYDYSNDPMYIEIRPWPRFWARILDYLLFITAAGFIYGKVTGSQISPGNSLWLNIAAIAAWVLIEALLLCLLGTTPGKWLLNISVRDENGKKPGFGKALKRSLLVWLCGTLAGIPVISAVTLILSYWHLTKSRVTLWDSKAACSVTHDYMKSLKVFALIALISVITISQYLLPNNDRLMLGDFSTVFLNYYGIDTSRFSKSYSIDKEFEKLLDKGKYEEAEIMLFAELGKSPDPYTKDTIYHDLGVLYTETGEYLKAITYIEKSLKITPNSSVEYSNYGNALYALDRIQEARNAYNSASHLDINNSHVYYGLGMIYYDEYDYAAAKKEFTKYTNLERNDADGWIYLGLSCLYGDKDTIKAKEYLDKAMSLSPDYAGSIEAMALFYDYTGASDKARECYTNALAKNPDDYTLLCKAADFFYYKGSTAEAVKYADQAIALDNKKYGAYRIKANAYFYDDKKNEAMETVEAMLRSNPDDPVVYNIAGDIYYDAYEYKLAIGQYERAIEKNPMNENAHLGIIGSLYCRKRYSGCLSFALEAHKKFRDAEIPWYIGDAYSALNDPDNAISYYEKALEIDPDNQDLMLSIGWEHYYNGDFTKALEYADRILKEESGSFGGSYLREAAEKRKRSISEQIAEFVEENYMYFRPSSEFDSVRKELEAKEQASSQDILRLFSKAYKQDDMFSFVLYDEYYRQYLEMNEEKTIEADTIDDNIIYTRISSFNENTANEFIDVIDNIESPEDKYLVIDLRGNGGGDTNSGCNILDYLLPDCVVCNLIYKDGYSDSYYSDDEYIKFRHIFVLTDGDSASCSELVTLSLKTYLDNVTVIGAKTFGKGVGQIGFEDKENELAVFVVNHYWNVREINIMDKGIEPDVPVAGSGYGECMDEVRKLIAGQAG